MSSKELPSEWKVCILSEIGEVISGGTPKTNIEDYWNGDISWITPKDLSNFSNRYIKFGERNISKKGLASSSANLLPRGTILFSSRAPIGYLAIADGELSTNQGFKSIVVNQDNDNLFVYYLLKKNASYIEGMANGSTFKEISGKVFKNLEFVVPPLSEQKVIAHILSTLDDKIEVNNRINKTLEEMAQAVFKRWFVDFEFPNEEGEPYKSNGGEMVESDLGMIPKGWEVNRIDSISKVTIGKTPPRKNKECFSFEPSDIKWISIKDLGNSGAFVFSSNEYLTPAAVKKYNVKIVPDSTVILSFKLTIGRIGITVGEMATNEAIAHFNSLKKINYAYLYSFLKTYDFSQLGNTSSIATAVNSKIVKSIELTIPDEATIAKFTEVITPAFEEIKNRLKEIYKLEALRDALLPKLMSGEIRVPTEES